MKLTVKCSDTNPIGVRMQRRTLGTYDFKKTGTPPFENYEINSAPLDINPQESLVLGEVSYTCSNRIVSIIVAHKIREESKKVFAAIFEFKNVPSSFVFLLPTGLFIELYFEH